MNMNILNWIQIIAQIILLITEGISKSQAVSSAASKFKISESEIWKHGGF